MQPRIKEHKQTQHAAKACQRRGGSQHTQRRHRKHQTQHAQRPVSQGADQGLGGIGPQRIGGGSKNQPCQRQQRQPKDYGLGCGVHQYFLHGFAVCNSTIRAKRYAVNRTS